MLILAERRNSYPILARGRAEPVAPPPRSLADTVPLPRARPPEAR